MPFGEKARPAVLHTGVRQAGKSSLLQRLFKDADFVTFDKVFMAEEATENPNNGASFGPQPKNVIDVIIINF